MLHFTVELAVENSASCGSEPVTESIHSSGLHLAWQFHDEEAVERHGKTGDSETNELGVRIVPEREEY